MCATLISFSQAELTKFRVAPPSVAFRVWKALLSTSHPHAAHTLSALLEHCGLWLYCNPATHLRAAMFLEGLKQVVQSRFLGHNSAHVLESAYNACKYVLCVCFSESAAARPAALHFSVCTCGYLHACAN